jgi:hypothetical protein
MGYLCFSLFFFLCCSLSWVGCGLSLLGDGARSRIAADVTEDPCDGPALVAVGDVDVDGEGSDEFGPDPSSELLLIDQDLVSAEMEINLPLPAFSSSLARSTLESGIELPVESLDVSPSVPFFAGEAVGSVHQRLEFCKEKIGADEYILNIVKEGYRLPVFPGTERIRYRERYNRSARDEEAFVLEEVLRLETAGLVVRCVSQPLCCNPLSVAFKIKPDGSYKIRLVIDLSRHMNRMCTDSKYLMCTLCDVLAQTVKGDFQYVFHLEAAYHHLRIHPDSYKFLGFCVTIDGCKVFFVYVSSKAVPFAIFRPTYYLPE